MKVKTLIDLLNKLPQEQEVKCSVIDEDGFPYNATFTGEVDFVPSINGDDKFIRLVLATEQ